MNNSLTLTRESRFAFKNRITCPAIMLILVMFFSLVTWQETGVGIADVGIFILIAILSIHSVKLNRYFFILFLLFLSFSFSCLLGYGMYGFSIEIRSLVTYGISIVFVLSILSYRFNNKEKNSIINAYLVISAIGSLFVLLNVLKNDQTGYFRYTASFFGVYRDSLYMCAFQMGAIYICFNRILYFRNKFIYLFLFLLIFTGQLFAGDRTAVVITAFVIFYSLLVFFVKKKKILHFLIAVLLLFLIALMFYKYILPLLPEYTFGRLFNFDTYLEDNSRFIMWEKCFDIFKKHFLFGIGFNNNNVILLSQGLHYSHNVYLDILCGQGVIGFLLIAWYVLYAIKKSNNPLFLLGFAIASFATLFFVNGYNTMSFWLPMILVPFVAKTDLKRY